MPKSFWDLVTTATNTQMSRKAAMAWAKELARALGDINKKVPPKVRAQWRAEIRRATMQLAADFFDGAMKPRKASQRQMIEGILLTAIYLLEPALEYPSKEFPQAK